MIVVVELEEVIKLAGLSPWGATTTIEMQIQAQAKAKAASEKEAEQRKRGELN